MNTIVMNTQNGAVTEYTNFSFQSITPTHAGSADGLYLLGGDLDDTTKINGSFKTGSTQWGGAKRKLLDTVFMLVDGVGTAKFTVHGDSASYDYPFALRTIGKSRVDPGKGLRENNMMFEFTKTDGAAFRMDELEIPVIQSEKRRTK